MNIRLPDIRLFTRFITSRCAELRVVTVSLLMVTALSIVGCQPDSNRSADNKRAELTPKHTSNITAQTGTAMERLIIGTYTGTEATASQGIYTATFDSATKAFSALTLLAETHNPSWLHFKTSTQTLYAVDEQEAGAVTVFSLKNGVAEQIQRVSSFGAAPCYLSVSPDQKYLAVANYMGGNIAVFAIDPQTGKLSTQAQVKAHTGSGPNPDRQEAAHAHWVQWNNTQSVLYVVDLGIDEVKAYGVDAQTGQLGEGFTAYQAEPGAGPRHMVFHPEMSVVYVVNELTNRLTALRVQPDGRFVAEQHISTLPEGFSEHSQAAHIAIADDGAHVYVSNRGHNSIAVFAIADNGQLSVQQWQSTLGNWPRHFTLLDKAKTLLVANEQEGLIVAFDITENGLLEPSNQALPVSLPTFVDVF